MGTLSILIIFSMFCESGIGLRYLSLNRINSLVWFMIVIPDFKIGMILHYNIDHNIKDWEAPHIVRNHMI